MRPSASARGYDSRWAKARKTYLAAHPWCAMCAKQGKMVPALHVDHIKPHRGDQALFWSKENWAGLCANHHNSTKKLIEAHGYSPEIGADGFPTDPRHPAFGR